MDCLMVGKQAKFEGRAASGRIPVRARAVIRVGDLRPTDHVLDVGCGEGEVALEVAGCVERLHGLDIRSSRVQRAAECSARRGVGNTTFEATAIQDFPFEPCSWDVSLFMRVLGKSGGGWTVGEADFGRVLRATRRQAIVQAGRLRSEHRIGWLLGICEDHGFDAAWFVRPHLIVANRRGAGAQIRALPEQIYVRAPSGRTVLVPTARLHDDHPVVKTFEAEPRAAA